MVNLHGSYQVTKNIELFGLVNNLVNNHYYAAGTFFETDGFNSNKFGSPNFFVQNDPRTFLSAMPQTAEAQNRNAGELRGTVVDSTGAAVPGAEVHATETSTGLTVR